jgi:putative tricarboxylic transport membrane protein
VKGKFVSVLFAALITPISLFTLFALVVPGAHAQTPSWKPDKSVEIVIGAAPGGANDRIGRTLQRLLQDGRVNTPINVVNKPGGGQSLAFAYLNTHPGNPHYLGLASSSWLTTVAAGRGTVTPREMSPIVKLLDEYQIYFVRADSPLKSARDIVDSLRKNPASLSFGFSTSAGNPTHISIAELARQAGADPTKIKAVVFNSGTDTAIQVAGGHLDIGVQSPGSAMQLMQGGKLRFIGIAGPRRYGGVLAGVPTMREQGVDVIANTFYTIFGPRGLDAAPLAFWDDALSGVMKSDAIRKDLDFNFWSVDIVGHRELPAFLEKELDSYRRTLLALGLAK